MQDLPLFNEFMNEAKKTITYDQAVEIGDLETVVKKHIELKYPQFYYGHNSLVGSKVNREIPTYAWKELTKFAKDNKDKELQIAIEKFDELNNKYKS
jgi:hypothetical protein